MNLKSYSPKSNTINTEVDQRQFDSILHNENKKFLKSLFDVSSIFRNIGIMYINHDINYILHAIYSLVIENVTLIQKQSPLNDELLKAYSIVSEYVCDEMKQSIDIIINRPLGKPFCYFLYHYLSKLKSVLLNIKYIDKKVRQHKLEMIVGYLSMWKYFRLALQIGDQSILDDEFFSDIAIFTHVYTLFNGESNIRKIYSKPYSWMGLIMKGKESSHVNESYGGWISTYRMSKNIISYEENYKFLKRIAFKEYYGSLIHKMLTSNKKQSSIDFRHFYLEKIHFEKDYIITVDVENALEEVMDEKEVKIKLCSELNHDKIVESVGNQSLDYRDYNEFLSFGAPRLKKESLLSYFSTVLLFFHGGGFIGGDNSGHRIYSNYLVKHYPLIAVEYRLAPDYPYPAALNDAYRVYNYLTSDEVVNLLGYKPLNIILVGDSAGGNLASNLLNMLIDREMNQQVTGLYLIWPAMSLDSFQYSLAYLYCFKDKMLNFNGLNYMQKCYLQNNGSEDNRAMFQDNKKYICPIYASDSTLCKYPPTYFIAGTLDSLTVNSLIFSRRLHNLGIPVKFDLVKDMIHSFMHLVYLVKEVRSCFRNISSGLEFIIDVNKKAMLKRESMRLSKRSLSSYSNDECKTSHLLQDDTTTNTNDENPLPNQNIYYKAYPYDYDNYEIVDPLNTSTMPMNEELEGFQFDEAIYDEAEMERVLSQRQQDGRDLLLDMDGMEEEGYEGVIVAEGERKYSKVEHQIEIKHDGKGYGGEKKKQSRDCVKKSENENENDREVGREVVSDPEAEDAIVELSYINQNSGVKTDHTVEKETIETKKDDFKSE